MLGIQNIEAFIIASIALNLVPGPDTFYVLGRSLAQGRTVGVASAIGIAAGTLVHTLAAALGLSAIIAASSTAFLAVKLIGAAYLVFLGLRMMLGRRPDVPVTIADQGHDFVVSLRQGLVTNALNPKVALFFLAFLPQFVAPQTSSHFLSFLILGLIFAATSTIWGLSLAWTSATLSRVLRRDPRYLAYLNKAMGALLVGLGVRLAVSR